MKMTTHTPLLTSCRRLACHCHKLCVTCLFLYCKSAGWRPGNEAAYCIIEWYLPSTEYGGIFALKCKKCELLVPSLVWIYNYYLGNSIRMLPKATQSLFPVSGLSVGGKFSLSNLIHACNQM